jgi:hypothetical protein
VPSPNAVLTAIRDELVTAGLVRRASVAGSLPPVFIEPLEGPPAPGEREGTEAGTDLAVTLRLSGQTRPNPRSRVDVIDVVYRSRGTSGLKAARDLDDAIVTRLVHGSSYGVGLTAGGLFVLAVSVFAGLGPVSQDGPVRTELAKLAVEVAV